MVDGHIVRRKNYFDRNANMGGVLRQRFTQNQRDCPSFEKSEAGDARCRNLRPNLPS